MKLQKKRVRTWAAVAAAYALLLHTIVAGLAGGAMAAPSQLDAFGNVICSSQGTDGSPAVPGQPPNHSHLPECCLVGCPAVGGNVALSAPIVFPVSPVDQPAMSVVQHSGIGSGVDRSPLNPRAPPSLT